MESIGRRVTRLLDLFVGINRRCNALGRTRSMIALFANGFACLPYLGLTFATFPDLEYTMLATFPNLDIGGCHLSIVPSSEL